MYYIHGLTFRWLTVVVSIDQFPADPACISTPRERHLSGRCTEVGHLEVLHVAVLALIGFPCFFSK